MTMNRERLLHPRRWRAQHAQDLLMNEVAQALGDEAQILRSELAPSSETLASLRGAEIGHAELEPGGSVLLDLAEKGRWRLMMGDSVDAQWLVDAVALARRTPGAPAARVVRAHLDCSSRVALAVRALEWDLYPVADHLLAA